MTTPAHCQLRDKAKFSAELSEAMGDFEAANYEMQVIGTCNTVDDLAMAVKQLCHALKRHEPDSDTAARAMQYLQKHNLIGSPLR